MRPSRERKRVTACFLVLPFSQCVFICFSISICCTEFFVTLITLFKQYCWNNLLHNQVRSCLVYALTPSGAGDTPISALQTHVSLALNLHLFFFSYYKIFAWFLV